ILPPPPPPVDPTPIVPDPGSILPPPPPPPVDPTPIVPDPGSILPPPPPPVDPTPIVPDPGSILPPPPPPADPTPITPAPTPIVGGATQPPSIPFETVPGIDQPGQAQGSASGTSRVPGSPSMVASNRAVSSVPGPISSGPTATASATSRA